MRTIRNRQMAGTEALAAYAVLAPFCRQIVNARGQTSRLLRVVQDLLRESGCSHRSRILDAACGTGDVVARLAQHGYGGVTGSDGCRALLKQARSLPVVRRGMFKECRWHRLGDFFGRNGRFDFVFALGHSLPHAPPRVIGALMRDVFKGLNPGGTFAFDVRKWVRTESGNLIQPRRPVNVPRRLGKFESAGHTYWIDEVCSYNRGRQRITYHITAVYQGRHGQCPTRFATLQYYSFQASQAKKWLKIADFGDVEFRQPSEDWPYLIVVARKRL